MLDIRSLNVPNSRPPSSEWTNSPVRSTAVTGPVMGYSQYPSLPYAEFCQACRAFKPSELVPAIARSSAALGSPPYSHNLRSRFPPWGLAAVARESLLGGNEFRSGRFDGPALEKLMRKFAIAADRQESGPGDDGFLVSTMTRYTHEQLPYQESQYEETARSHAWMVEGLTEVETQVITESSLTDILDGLSLREAIGATFFLQTGAYANGGVYDPSWLDQKNFGLVFDVYPREAIEIVAERLTTTPACFRSDWRRNTPDPSAASRFGYTPLVATPFVDMGDGMPVAPATQLIMRTVAPGGLYYAGMAAHGPAFANDLGLLFEHYIGRQLRLIEGADVHSEIRYGKGGGSKSVDWFVVLPNLVILVEVKSRRLGPAARAGGPLLLDVLASTLRKARIQLGRTLEQLETKNPAFADIPTDRPMLGLIVTAEPFYTGSAFLLEHDVALLPGGGLPDVPIAVTSAREVEWLVTHGGDVEGLLLDQMGRRDDGVVGLREIGRKPGVENPILAVAWESYPWPRSDIEGAPLPT